MHSIGQTIIYNIQNDRYSCPDGSNNIDVTTSDVIISCSSMTSLIMTPFFITAGVPRLVASSVAALLVPVKLVSQMRSELEL